MNGPGEMTYRREVSRKQSSKGPKKRVIFDYLLQAQKVGSQLTTMLPHTLPFLQPERSETGWPAGGKGGKKGEVAQSGEEKPTTHPSPSWPLQAASLRHTPARGRCAIQDKMEL